MLVGVVAYFLLYTAACALLESESDVTEIGAVVSKLSIELNFNELERVDGNETENLDLDDNDDIAFEMFETGTGINLFEYLKEKLYEQEVEAFKQDESLIDAAIVEYHKYLQLTKSWVNGNQDNKFVYIPSKLIDFVWHWHILQTYEYHLMCNQQFDGKFLHHRPYFGKEKESDKFKNRINKYTKTLRDYYTYFGYHPPKNVWGRVHGSCDEMHQCDGDMVADCDDEMHTCDGDMVANCDEMHTCDGDMIANCDEMHTCDGDMVADCDEMHQCDGDMIADCDHDCSADCEPDCSAE